MSVRFCVLASGSAGNCAFLQSNGFGLLIDIGLGPRFIASRLATIGYSWNDVNAVVLTHTHSDHWKDATLAHLKAMRVPMYCSPFHHAELNRFGGRFRDLEAAGLIRSLEIGAQFSLHSGLFCQGILVPHDSEPTLAFRLEGPAGLFGPQWSLGYASDLGEARSDLLETFRDVSILAIEFNHCERMERASRRPKFLIDRVLGPLGHLSNDQASEAVRTIVQTSSLGSLRHLVQLHLSRDCNRANLAGQIGKDLLAELGSTASVTTARQDTPSRMISLDEKTSSRSPAVGRPVQA